CSRAAALSRLLLSRRADHDRAVHFDLHHDVGDRRSQRRISALGAGCPRATLRDSPWQSAGRNHSIRDSGLDFFSLRSLGRSSRKPWRFSSGRAHGLSGFLRAYRSWLRNRVAYGFDARLSRGYQFISDSYLATLRRALSARGSFGMDSASDAHQSADLWG